MSGFSVAGSSQFGIQDDRNKLVFWYLRYIERIRPKIAIIENVPGLLTKKSKDGETFLDIIKKIGLEMGYQVAYKVLNAQDFGVPQSRKRAFIVFHYTNVKFDFPELTHFKTDEFPLFESYSPVTTVDDALSDLPFVSSGEKGSGLPYRSDPVNTFQTYCRTSSKGVQNHDPMKHTSRVIERFRIIGHGQSLKDVPISHGQIAYGTGKKTNKPFKYNNYRLDPTKVSLTIPASYQSLFVHPYQDRNLTAREGARLMSYPDRYKFLGPKTLMSWESGLSQYNQIGNSVCPLVAKALSSCVLKYLESIPKKLVKVKPSSLLKNLEFKTPDSNFSLNKANENASDFKCVYFLDDFLEKSEFYNTKENCFIVNKLNIPVHYVVLAYNLLKTSKCTICDNFSPPHGDHSDGMSLLISKSNIQSLVSKKRDNGLDFHLRVLTGNDTRTANEVAIILESMGVARVISAQNPRTGKMVKSIKLI